MASESSVTDLTVHLFADEKKVGDDIKEEEKHDPEGVSVAEETTKEEKIEQVGENNDSLHECQVSETNEGKSNDVEIFTSKEPVNLEFKQENLKDDEVGLASENESKPEEAPLVSSAEAEAQETPNSESSMDIVNVELIKSEDSKGEVQEIVHAEVPTLFVLDTFESPKVDTSTLTSINVPVKDLEVESGSPEEQKPKVSAETKVESEDAMDEVQVLVPAQIPADTSEDPERIDVDSITPTNIEVPVKDLEIDSGSPEEKKAEETAKTKEHTELIKSEDSKEEVHEFVPAKLPIISSEAPEKNYVDSSQLTTVELPVKDLEIDYGSPEEQKSGSAETRVGIKLIKSGDSKDEGQELVPTEILTLTSEAPEKNVDSSAPSSTDVPAKDIEVESGSPQVRKQEESAKTKEPSSDVNTNDGRGEVAGSTSYEEMFSGVAEVVEKKDEDFKEEIQTIVKSPMVPKATSEEAQTLYDGDKASKEVAVKKDDAIAQDGIETSPVLDVSPDAKVSIEDEKASKPGEVVKESKDETSNGDSLDTVPKVSEVSLAKGNVLVEDKSVVNENLEAIERGLAETNIHPTVPEVSTEQVIAPENVEEPLNLSGKELDISPEASDILSRGEKVSAGDEMNETLKGKGAALVVTTKDITTSDQPFDQLIEKTIESSRSDIDASIGPSLEAVKDVISSETYKEKKYETSEDLSLVERDLDASDVNKEDVKAEGAIEDAKDNPIVSSEKSKDQEPIVSSDTKDAKLIKEVTKGQSNIFAKVKRSIIKAKKAILGKSPGPKAVASEAKDENP